MPEHVPASIEHERDEHDLKRHGGDPSDEIVRRRWARVMAACPERDKGLREGRRWA